MLSPFAFLSAVNDHLVGVDRIHLVMTSPQRLRGTSTFWRADLILTFFYACAALQLIRFYSKSTTFYLSMARYLNGTERLPFQERVFPILFLRPLSHSRWMQTHFANSVGGLNAEHGAFYLLSLISFAFAAFYTQRLYGKLSQDRLLQALVFPVFLFTVTFTYVIHSEANFSYPYDLPSLAFFAAGLFYIYERRFIPLLLVVFIGTFNRETTLFLIPLYIIDAASTVGARQAFDFRRVSLSKVFLLGAIWVAIKVSLAHHFAGNDASESYLRIHDNLLQLRPRLLPALLNICGYTLPIVVLFRRWIRPQRFRNYLWVVPLWFAVMFCSGVLVETRIYGELCPLCAVSLVLILEEKAASRHAVGTTELHEVTRDSVEEMNAAA